MPQTLNKKMNASKVDGLLRTVRAIQADASGNLPTRIMLLRCGNWTDSVKGSLTITPLDLQEFKQNFDGGVGLVSKDVGLPIDFSHEEWAEAAGWIKGLEIEGDALYANPVEWSDSGADALNGKRFKCISPSFYPAARGGWEDPEDLTSVVGNVLVGAGLTNIPFFKDLTPVTASRSAAADSDEDNVVYISANNEGEKRMTLDEVRVKEPTALTDAERQLLADNKTQLSGDELKKFGLAEEKVVEAAAKTTGETISEEDRQLLADIRSGKLKTVKEGETVVEADRLNALEASVKKYETKEAEAIVEAHVKRGAIKADTKDRWVSRLLSADATERTALEEDLTNLPSNEQLGKELGTSAVVEASTGKELLAKLAADRVAKAQEEGKALSVIEAQREVLAANADLAEQIRKENKF